MPAFLPYVRFKQQDPSTIINKSKRNKNYHVKTNNPPLHLRPPPKRPDKLKIVARSNIIAAENASPHTYSTFKDFSKPYYCLLSFILDHYNLKTKD